MISNPEAAANIARNVQKLLNARKWSQRKLAKMTGDPHMTIVSALSGEHVPSAGILGRIAEALGVAADDLIFGRKKNSRRSA